MIINKKVVVFCDDGEDDWNDYFKLEFNSEGIEFSDLTVFDTPDAFEQSFEILMFDWGGMSLGNSMLEHLIRHLYEIAENNPSRDFVLLSLFTKNAYEDMIDRQTVKLFNIYSINEYIKKLKSENNGSN